MNKSFGALVLGIVMLSGCATAARTDHMTVSSAPSARTAHSPLKSSISIETVSGGENTNPLWTSEIGNAEFRGALEASLRSTQLLADGPGRYALKAILLSVKQPMVGFDMTVTTTVQYTLTERSSSRVVFDKPISSSYTATVGDAFLGYERLRLANEGAAKNNISQLIDELYRLELQSDDISLAD
jgi:hypothetical protein